MMESDKKQFETDHLEQESSDFLEYQHKKLEKVAEIIKEEERAAKLLEETENAGMSDTPKTTVVINSIVKHEKQTDTNETADENDNLVDGLYIEPVDAPDEENITLELEEDEQRQDSVDIEEIPTDESTFEAVDEVIQAAQNDFETESEPEELSLEEEVLSLEQDVEAETEAYRDALPDIAEEHLEVVENKAEVLSADVESNLDEVTDELEIDAPIVSEPDLSEDDSEIDVLEVESDTSLSDDELTQKTDDELTDESDAVVDFAAAEEATEAEAVEASTTVDYTQPKISKIGRLLLELGKISRADTKKILRTQKKHGLLFGDAALKLGLINDDDIQKVVAMQFNYHYLQAGQGKFSDDLVAAYAPFSKKVENYRALRSQLMMRWFKKGHRALAIVGANSGDGVSYLTANLGVVFSQLGARTLITEANMRSPRQQEIFNIRTNNGLSDMIVGKIGRDAIQELDSIPDLSVLHAGTVPPNPQELLGRTSFNILFKNLSDDYDVILIDTPPVVQSADAQSVIEMSEGAMLVSRLHQTKHTDVLEMRHLIEMTGASIVSAVMNDF